MVILELKKCSAVQSGGGTQDRLKQTLEMAMVLWNHGAALVDDAGWHLIMIGFAVRPHGY